MTNQRDTLEGELFDLPMMAVDLSNAMIIVGDAFDIDPITLIDAYFNQPRSEWARFAGANGERECRVMLDLIDDALDSSTMIPDLTRALEIIAQLRDLD